MTDTTYSIPLEVGFEDIRQCRIDGDTTCADVLTALLGRSSERGGSWAILETVYERGVLSVAKPSDQGGDKKKTNKARQTSTKNNKNEKKQPVMVIKELRLLEPSQPMAELVPEVLAGPSQLTRSVLSVINAENEVVVFMNPFFRMQTGLPLSHISLFPDPDLTVRKFNRLVRTKLGLAPDDDRFALFGFYGKHVGKIDEKCVIGELKATWEGGNDGARNVGFFQFQAVPEKMDQECLGIDRASWLFVKKESGLWQSTKKLYCVLKGTTMFMYSDKSNGQLVSTVTNCDGAKVINLGRNVMRTRSMFQIHEIVKQDNKHHAVVWTFSSPYPTRVGKWLKVLARCRRTYESQVPVTYDDPNGEHWLHAGRLNNPQRRPFHRRSYRHRHEIDPMAVPPGEMTIEQRARFDHIDAMLKQAELGGEVVKKAGMDQSSETVEDWLARVRLFAMEATGLQRPGFAAKIITPAKQLIRAVGVFAPALSGSLRSSVLSSDSVDKVHEACTQMANVYKHHILDLASFPASPTRHEIEYGPQLTGLRMILEQEKYYEHVFEEESNTGVDNPESATQQEEEPFMETTPDIDEETVIGEQDKKDAEQESKKERSLLKKMKKMLISSRPSAAANPPAQLVIEIDPESPTRTELDDGDVGIDTEDMIEGMGEDAIINATVNEPTVLIPPRRSAVAASTEQDDTQSVASSKSSFSQRAKAFWNRVSSPLSSSSKPDSKKQDHLQATAAYPYALPPARQFTVSDYGMMANQGGQPMPNMPMPANMPNMPPMQYMMMPNMPNMAQANSMQGMMMPYPMMYYMPMGHPGMMMPMPQPNGGQGGMQGMPGMMPNMPNVPNMVNQNKQ